MIPLPPDPSEFKGQPARRWIDALVRWLTRARLLTQGHVGIRVTETPAGLLLHVAAAGSVTLAYASGGVTARSGTTLGSGTVRLYTISGTAMSNSGVDVTAYNYSGSAVSSSKYCALVQINGQWVVLSAEC